MSKPTVDSRGVGRPRFPTPMIDKCVAVTISACAFAVIVFPILTFVTAPDVQAIQSGTESRPEPRIFWPAMTVISILLLVQSRSRFSKVALPPHIVCLLAYLAFAGASVLWAFSPESSLVRFTQQAMVVTSIVLPAMLAGRGVDMMRSLFLCFAFALILNVIFILEGSVTIAQYGSTLVDIGYQGYFLGKNYLGECAEIAILLAFHEMCYRGWRRALGVIVLGIAILLLFLSDSKTALALAVISPFLARLTLIVRKVSHISPAIILLSIPVCYLLISSVSNFNMYRLSYIVYGDSTFTGRAAIWDFAQSEIGLRPLLGWGYQSFWLVPDSPAFEAPGWVKFMPNAHNGYYDTTLEMGYAGLALLLGFIIATLHAIGRVADRDPNRAWLLLSLALIIIMHNYLESMWMRGFEFMWVVFVIVAAEIGRYWQPFPVRSAAYRLRSPKPDTLSPLLAQTSRLRMRRS